MAGREKRRQEEALDGDEKRLRRRQEEAALLLRKIRGSVRFSPFPQSLVCPNPLPPVIAGANACGPRRRRARTLGRRGGGRGALSVYRSQPLPELLLLRRRRRRRRRRRCVPVPMVRLLFPSPHLLLSLSHSSVNFNQLHRILTPMRGCVCDCSACSYDSPVGTDVLSLLHKDYHASRLSVILRVLLVVQQLLQQNKHCSKRDIFYMYPSFFVEQAVVDRAINDICILFKCSRHNLNVVGVTSLLSYLKL
ncbi:hypothetical protein PR202_gb10920 [Eleusine coracana subsp. coracana]|uniref:Spo11/DNA topoisomerase VI subunit A N-terminal domain-containing protein n=1 Tax=Eleusine coracana subsp. coracana TaxID=191504 RepID=A0AAV5EL86_ELECO|nr:hypothetical protein PR202_gb10920 [Eleusine coracana subsp. coracana]